MTRFPSGRRSSTRHSGRYSYRYCWRCRSGRCSGWKRGDLLGAAQRLVAAAIIAAIAIAAAFAFQHGGPVLAPFGVGLAIFVMAGALTDIAERTMVLRAPLGVALRRAAGLPRSSWGTAVAHFGIGVTLLGIVAVHAPGVPSTLLAARPGDLIRHRPLPAFVRRHVQSPGPNYRDVVAHFTVRRTNGDLLGVMEPTQHTSPPQHGDHRSRADAARRQPDYLSLGDPNQMAAFRYGSISSRRCS